MTVYIGAAIVFTSFYSNSVHLASIKLVQGFVQIGCTAVAFRDIGNKVFECSVAKTLVGIDLRIIIFLEGIIHDGPVHAAKWFQQFHFDLLCTKIRRMDVIAQECLHAFGGNNTIKNLAPRKVFLDEVAFIIVFLEIEIAPLMAEALIVLLLQRYYKLVVIPELFAKLVKKLFGID